MLITQLISKYNLTKTDDDGTLSLYSYQDCKNTSSDELKECRGIIVENSSGNVLWKSKYVDEYTDTMPQNIDVSNYKIYACFEGTTVRLFNYNNKWYTSTIRKLCAFDSRWGSSTSFGTYFIEGLNKQYGLTYDELVNVLDPRYMYTFFLKCNSENRIVCFTGPYSTIYHTYTHSQNGDLVNYNTPIQKQIALHFKPNENIQNYINNIDFMWAQGILLRNGDSEVKIISGEYAKLKSLRGNQSSLKKAYLCIRNDCTKYKLFINLYAERINLFDNIEKHIKNVARNLTTIYTERYVDNKFVCTDPLSHSILKQIFKRNSSITNADSLYWIFLHHLSIIKPSELYQLISSR